MNIAFSCDENYAPYLATSIFSILRTNRENYIKFYILDLGISESSKKYISNLCFEHGKEIEFISVSKYELEKDDLPKNISHISIATYARLKITEYIKNVEKIIYIDVDTITNQNLLELWNTNLGDKYLGACFDSYIEYETNNYKYKIGLSDQEYYFNAGVLLLNMSKLYSFKLYEKSINCIKEFNNIEYQDQDIMNIIFKNKVYFLNTRFNFMPSLKNRVKNQKKLNSLENIDSPISIFHYCSAEKPWHKKCSHSNANMFIDIFNKLKNKPESWIKKVEKPSIFIRMNRFRKDFRNKIKYNIK